jgi:uncharacterized protein
MKTVFEKVHKDVIKALTEGLPAYLTYHSVNHTIYVLKMAEYLSWREGLAEDDIYLVKIAALFHDIGFLEGRENHEEKGCVIAKKELGKYNLSTLDIDKICGMIMATKIPQKPKNHLEEILADADLEYLSTENFEPVSEMLFNEIKHYNPDFTREEWYNVQIDFMEKHHYHTDFCKKYKESFKKQHVMKLKGLDLKTIKSKKNHSPK